MSKSILAISSSPRKGSNSDLLCDSFLRGARKSGHQTGKIQLKDLTIGYCTGCGACANGKRRCPQQDDMPAVLDRMIAADAIVMATPVYFYSMNAQMKTLIDRTCSRYTEIVNKEFYVIVAAADADTRAMARTIDGFRGFTACLGGARERGVIYGVGAWEAGAIASMPAMQEAYDMGASVPMRQGTTR